MAAGEIVAALIGRPVPGGHHGVPPVQVTRGGTLAGTSELVRDAQVCDRFACVVPTRDGDRVAIIPRDAPGVTVEPRATVGGFREAAVTFAVPLEAAVVLSKPLEPRWVADLEALIAVFETAEIVGACQTVLEFTRTHATSRVQFGRCLGSFQAVQHRMADMLIDLDGCRWTLYRAASEMTASASPGALVDHLVTWTADATRRILQGAHQIHGGVGFIREHPLHLFFGSQKAYELTRGAPGGHLGRLAAALLDTPEEQAS
jgi:alkylation response protein AidB-like acyl-CoA dehydrogenase